jgi:hypothetical protein
MSNTGIELENLKSNLEVEICLMLRKISHEAHEVHKEGFRALCVLYWEKKKFSVLCGIFFLL